MSRETLSHLNSQTLIGYTERRGHAWHYRADLQGAEPNHYPRAIPTADVYRRLFDWSAIEADVQAVAVELRRASPAVGRERLRSARRREHVDPSRAAGPRS